MWRTSQQPKLLHLTGEELDCSMDDFVQEVEHVIANYKAEEGTANGWLVQTLAACARREVLRCPASEARQRHLVTSSIAVYIIYTLDPTKSE